MILFLENQKIMCLAYKKESITVKVRVEKATWKQIVHLLCQGKQRSDYTVKGCKNFPTTYFAAQKVRNLSIKLLSVPTSYQFGAA